MRYVKLNNVETPPRNNNGKGWDSELLSEYNPLGKIELQGFADVTAKASSALYNTIKTDIQQGAVSKNILMYKQEQEKNKNKINKPKINLKLNKDLVKIKLEKSLEKIQDQNIDMGINNLKDLKIFMKKLKNSTCDPKRKYLINEIQKFDREL